MLVEFAFENYKCYRDEVTLDMTAAPLGEHADSLLVDGSSDATLPIAAIYGPNGGGKSSVLQAFECLSRTVVYPFILMRLKGGKLRPLDAKPYLYDADSKEGPTSFKVVFRTGEYTYRYILAVSQGSVSEEYLHRRKPGKGATAMLFERRSDLISLGASLKRKGVSTDIDDMMPYLSYLAINHDFEAIEEAFGWFLKNNLLDYSYASQEDYFIEISDLGEKRRIIELLNNMDIDITDFRFEHGSGDRLEGIYLRHSADESEELELDEESNGTKKLFGLVPQILRSLDEGTVLIADELDAKLHPKLLRYIIKLFTSRATNPKGAQLIFTSHDVSTLNSTVFRRDEIWFAAKGDGGPSRLYSLADIADVDGRRIRTQNAYDKQYLEGRYGADPYLKNMLGWDGKDEQ